MLEVWGRIHFEYTISGSKPKIMAIQPTPPGHVPPPQK